MKSSMGAAVQTVTLEPHSPTTPCWSPVPTTWRLLPPDLQRLLARAVEMHAPNREHLHRCIHPRRRGRAQTDGRATTHWHFARELQRRFPAITVEEDRIFVRDGRVWTSAGMTACIDLALAMVEGDLGNEVSSAVAKKLVVHHRRSGGQSQFSTFSELESKVGPDPDCTRLREEPPGVPEPTREDRHVFGVAPEAGDVALHPLERGGLIGEPIVPEGPVLALLLELLGGEEPSAPRR